jgi:hypothetical protein
MCTDTVHTGRKMTEKQNNLFKFVIYFDYISSHFTTPPAIPLLPNLHNSGNSTESNIRDLSEEESGCPSMLNSGTVPYKCNRYSIFFTVSCIVIYNLKRTRLTSFRLQNLFIVF